MYKHILIASDGSELAERAAVQGLELATALKAKVTAVTVTEPWTAVVTGEMALGFPYAEYEKTAAENAARTKLFLGSQATKVLTLSTAPVLICR